MEGTFGDSPVQPLCPSDRVALSRATAGCSGVCPMVFWDPPQWWRLHAHPGVTHYSFWTPSYWKNYFVFKLHFLYFSLPSTEKSGSASFTVHHLILIQAGKISLQPSFPQFGQPQLSLPLPTCQILLPLNPLCGPSLDWLQYHQPFPGHRSWICLTSTEQRVRIPSQPDGLTLPHAAQDAAEAQSWFTVSLSRTHSPMSFCENPSFG